MSGSLTLVGFDSAWADNPKAPGAICALHCENGTSHEFVAPRLANFAEATMLVRDWATTHAVLIAIDQPTIVPNLTGARPVDRVAGSLIGWLGGGVQPAYRGKTAMFGDDAPVWCFFRAIGACHDPHRALVATTGCHVMEVFPAMALASLHADFFGRLSGPRYNPVRVKTFKPASWVRVAEVAAAESRRWTCADLTCWFETAAALATPRKSDQDRLDAALCLLIALRWRFGEPQESICIGDTTSGYIVAPVTPQVRQRLTKAAVERGVAVR